MTDEELANKFETYEQYVRHCEKNKFPSLLSADGWENAVRDYAKVKLQEPPSKDKKYDQGKAMVGLMKKDFSLALLAVAEVTTYGVKKYNQPGSWKLVENAKERYEDALGRHDLEMQKELRCAESGLTHAAHRAWNALATLQLLLEEL